MADLADVALDFREHQRRSIRIATTYPLMTRRFLHERGIHYFTIVNAEGAIEAAPTIGYADAIVDLVQTGTTLRENHLKPVSDGVILESQACLIGNVRLLRDRGHVRDAARVILEYIDAALEGKSYSQVTVNMRGSSDQDIARRLAAHPITRGLQGPTIAPIYGTHEDETGQWMTITLILANKRLLEAIDLLRAHGATDVVVTPVRYLFRNRSYTFERLCDTLAQL
jgi:ATP phosphoribosyltransferase